MRQRTGSQKQKHKHDWSYCHSAYSSPRSSEGIVCVRRYCKCGVEQHSYTTGRWYRSRVGATRLFDHSAKDHVEGYA